VEVAIMATNAGVLKERERVCITKFSGYELDEWCGNLEDNPILDE